MAEVNRTSARSAVETTLPVNVRLALLAAGQGGESPGTRPVRKIHEGLLRAG
jgi:hypothetical protein